jgi:hypothetical protein
VNRVCPESPIVSSRGSRVPPIGFATEAIPLIFCGLLRGDRDDDLNLRGLLGHLRYYNSFNHFSSPASSRSGLTSPLRARVAVSRLSRPTLHSARGSHPGDAVAGLQSRCFISSAFSPASLRLSVISFSLLRARDASSRLSRPTFHSARSASPMRHSSISPISSPRKRGSIQFAFPSQNEPGTLKRKKTTAITKSKTKSISTAMGQGSMIIRFEEGRAGEKNMRIHVFLPS